MLVNDFALKDCQIESMTRGDLLWKIIENDVNKDMKLDLKEIKVLGKKLCSEKIKELKNGIEKYQKKKIEDEKRLEDLRIEHYLTSNVMPLLLESMGQLAKEKPNNPIEFIAKYLLTHNNEKVVPN